MVSNHAALFTFFFSSSNLALHILSDNICIWHCVASISYMQASIKINWLVIPLLYHYFKYRYCITPNIWYDCPYMLYNYIFHDIPNYFYFYFCHYNMFIRDRSWFMRCNIIHKVWYMAQNITSHENIYCFLLIFILPGLIHAANAQRIRSCVISFEQYHPTNSVRVTKPSIWFSLFSNLVWIVF